MSELKIASTTFRWGTQTYIMGIINVTPDSFSGDGLLSDQEWVKKAVEQGVRFAQEGAHILDVGGESTRPGAEPVDAETELQRVVPVIEALSRAVDLPISIDTYKAEVAAAALDAGAHLVNDVWGLRMDPALAGLCAQRHTPVIVMHNRSHPRNAVQEARLGGRYIGTIYDDLLMDITNELQVSINLARSAGVPDEHIIIDPGIGFGKTVEQNLTLLNYLDTFKVLGYPILLGTSNKSFIGYTLNTPPEDRLEGTAATVAIGIARGADIVRVHQVKEISRVARMADAIVRTGSKVAG
ncbi:MAG: dihydropteroate synthase [Anaerolineae bacterium]|nr:dihydropteroate synthase [Anaerolineales bacterium]MCQ3974392.1 dihydropteroate synthase [Anaerolineae bacterium]